MTVPVTWPVSKSGPSFGDVGDDAFAGLGDDGAGEGVRVVRSRRERSLRPTSSSVFGSAETAEETMRMSAAAATMPPSRATTDRRNGRRRGSMSVSTPSLSELTKDNYRTIQLCLTTGRWTMSAMTIAPGNRDPRLGWCRHHSITPPITSSPGASLPTLRYHVMRQLHPLAPGLRIPRVRGRPSH